MDLISIKKAEKKVRQELLYLPKDQELERLLKNLVELARLYGEGAEGPWLVFRTPFHGGGLIGEYDSPIAAIKAAIRNRIAGCECGCSGVVLSDRKIAAAGGRDQMDLGLFSCAPRGDLVVIAENPRLE